MKFHLAQVLTFKDHTHLISVLLVHPNIRSSNIKASERGSGSQNDTVRIIIETA